MIMLIKYQITWATSHTFASSLSSPIFGEFIVYNRFVKCVFLHFLKFQSINSILYWSLVWYPRPNCPHFLLAFYCCFLMCCLRRVKIVVSACQQQQHPNHNRKRNESKRRRANKAIVSSNFTCNLIGSGVHEISTYFVCQSIWSLMVLATPVVPHQTMTVRRRSSVQKRRQM